MQTQLNVVNAETDYDTSNIFAKILRKELPTQKIFENEHALAFYDAYPQAPIHALIIPKGPYKDVSTFYKNATSEEILAFKDAISKTIDLLNIENSGFRLITNCGKFGHQDIMHLHFHLVSGHPLGKMLSKNASN